MWNLQPGVARNYLNEVIYDFEEFAKAAYLPALNDLEADERDLLAAVSYVGSRNETGHTSRLQEILTTRMQSRIKREIDAACIDALVKTTDDPHATARFLALVATQQNPLPAAQYCQEALRSLGPPAIEILLQELLSQDHDANRLAKLARLLYRVSRVPSPEPFTHWVRGEYEPRKSAVHQWRQAIQAKGALPAKPAPTTQPAFQ